MCLHILLSAVRFLLCVVGSKSLKAPVVCTLHQSG